MLSTVVVIYSTTVLGTADTEIKWLQSVQNTAACLVHCREHDTGPCH